MQEKCFFSFDTVIRKSYIICKCGYNTVQAEEGQTEVLPLLYYVFDLTGHLYPLYPLPLLALVQILEA